MKINYFKLTLTILVVAFVVPQIAMAAWWNPFSWGWVNKIFHFQRIGQQQTQTSPLEKACVQSGGKITQIDCYCADTKDFFNSCLIGGCACTPDPKYKKQIKSCDCGEGKCWDGTKCTNLNSVLNQNNETTGWKTYTNTKYGFEVSLPTSWANYTIDTTKNWEGRIIISMGGEGPDYVGPEIFIKNPALESQYHFTGIPIMVITPEVWQLISEEKVSVSAAPIGPQKIGQNNKYVFATPPRYVGFGDELTAQQIEEVYNIVKTFKTTNVSEKATAPINLNADWKTYSSATRGFSFKYPQNIKVTEANDVVANRVVLFHSVPYKHADPCDFVGMPNTPLLANLVDFNVWFNLLDGNIENIINDSSVPSYSSPKQRVTVGGLNGYKYTAGVEMCGAYYYYLALSPTKTLWISRAIVSELEGASQKDMGIYSAIPGIINTQNADALLDKIVSTLKILK